MALVDVIMPQMGESIAEGTISKWHKKVGDKIGKDETLLEISTDKVDSEIPAPAAGIVSELLFQETTTVGVNTVIARINTDPSVASWVPCTMPNWFRSWIPLSTVYPRITVARFFPVTWVTAL